LVSEKKPDIELQTSSKYYDRSEIERSIGDAINDGHFVSTQVLFDHDTNRSNFSVLNK